MGTLTLTSLIPTIYEAMDTVSREVLDDVEQTLRTEFMATLSRTQRRDPHENMAEILNNLDLSGDALPSDPDLAAHKDSPAPAAPPPALDSNR